MVRAKMLMFEKAVVFLSQGDDKYAMDAESKVNAMEMEELIMQLNSFRMTVIQKQEEIKACEKNLKEINKKQNIQLRELFSFVFCIFLIYLM